MTDSSQSGLWQHAARLQPGLRNHIRVNSQDYRGQRWYVLHDESSGRFLRLNTSAYELIARFDNDHTLEEILELVNASRAQDQPMHVDEVLEVLAQLHEFEAIQGGMALSTADALRRYHQRKQRQLQQRWGNPLSLRFPLVDPNRWLDALLPLAKMIFSRTGWRVWLLVLSCALLLVVLDYERFSTALARKSFGWQEVLSLFLLYPFIKALHELGHGLAIKAWGGEVHEAGVFLLVFLPVPYVDGSASWGFREKRKRAVVAAAGILVELFLAALGILIWSVTEPGLINALALNVTLIAGLSTLLYNGNPLLRFDGYYVLEDLIEMPNLSSRSTRYYLYLFQRYLLKVPTRETTIDSAGERFWLLTYGLLSPLYRLFILLGISLYLSAKYLVVGVILASWAIAVQVVKPLLGALRYVVSNPALESRRHRGALILTVPVLVLAIALLVPMPLITRTQGVVWINNQGQLTAPIDGGIKEVVVESGGTVEKGDLILRLENQNLETTVRILRARRTELQAVHAREKVRSRVGGAIAVSDLQTLVAELDRREKQLEATVVRSPIAGIVVFDDPHELVGKYVEQGETLAYIVQQGHPTVRAVVGQDHIGNFRSGVKSVEVMLSDNLGLVHQSSLVRQIPAGSVMLPSAALGTSAGGLVTTDLADGSGLTATAEIFQFDIALPAGVKTSGLGGRAFVRLHHGSEPLWRQWSRSLRQLFLSRLSA